MYSIWCRLIVLVICVLPIVHVRSIYVDGKYASDLDMRDAALTRMDDWRGHDFRDFGHVDLLCMTYALADIACEGEVEGSFACIKDKISVELTEYSRCEPSRELLSLVATKPDEGQTSIVMKKRALHELLGATRSSEVAYLFRKGFLLCHALRLMNKGWDAVTCKVLLEHLVQADAVHLVRIKKAPLSK